MIIQEKIALIPAYEATDLLNDLVEAVEKAQFLPIVIDDGSGLGLVCTEFSYF